MYSFKTGTTGEIFMFGFVTKDVWMRWKFSQKMLTLRKLAFAEEQSMD